MKIHATRKLIRLGNSLYIAVPSMFLKVNGISKGDVLLIEGNLKALKLKKPKEKAGTRPA